MKYSKELHDYIQLFVKMNEEFPDDSLATVEETQALLDEIDRLNAERRWIPVSERLPENKQDVFVLNKYGDCKARTYLDDGDIRWWLHSDDNYCDELEYATHWMPLPPPPPEEK